MAKFWAQNQKFDMSDQLNMIIPCDVKDLLGTTIITSMEGAQDTIHMSGEETTLEDGISTEDLQVQLM